MGCGASSASAPLGEKPTGPCRLELKAASTFGDDCIICDLDTKAKVLYLDFEKDSDEGWAKVKMALKDPADKSVLFTANATLAVCSKYGSQETLDANDYGGYGSGLDATYEAMFPGSGMYYWQLKYVLCFKKEDAIVATVICQAKGETGTEKIYDGETNSYTNSYTSRLTGIKYTLVNPDKSAEPFECKGWINAFKAKEPRKLTCKTGQFQMDWTAKAASMSSGCDEKERHLSTTPKDMDPMLAAFIPAAIMKSCNPYLLTLMVTKSIEGPDINFWDSLTGWGYGADIDGY